MGRENQGGLEKDMLTHQETAAFDQAAELDLQLQIQEEREFMMAKALNEGRAGEVFTINSLPDAHFKKIIEERQRKK